MYVDQSNEGKETREQEYARRQAEAALCDIELALMFDDKTDPAYTAELKELKEKKLAELLALGEE